MSASGNETTRVVTTLEMLSEKRAPFSHRHDDRVPSFEDTHPIAFMDGDCALCTWGARVIARLDRKGAIRICPTQSKLGSAMLIHHGMAPDDPETWLYLENGVAHTSIDAIISVGRRVGGIGWLLQPLRLLPAPARDWLYRRIARNRYSLFGRTDMCAVPDPKLRARLIGTD